MKNDRIENLLDELSSGLKADPEMRLDIKSELRAHLDDKIAEGEHSGLSETESTEQALKSFGDIVVIADSLVEANRPRMKLKARLWRAATILLIPAVIICALVSFYPTLSNISIVEGFTAISQNSPLFTPYSWVNKSLKLFDKSYSAEDNLILHGDITQKYNWQKQKALCDKFPNNKVYRANYILQLINERKGKELTKAKIFAELKRAQTIEPDNALYNYLTAGLMLDDACSYKTRTKSIRDGAGKRKSFNETVDFKVKNRRLLDQAMQEYLAGNRKKYCRSYTIQLVQQRLKIMGEPTNLAASIKQMMLSASTVIPHLSLYRKTGKIVPKYTQLLVKENRKNRAMSYMQSWKTYLQHQLDDSDYLISSLVLIASAKEFKSFPQLYRELGKKRQAKVTEQQLQQIAHVRENWRRDMTKYSNHETFKKAGVLCSVLLPALGIEFSEKDLSISRRIDYINVEKFVIALLNILFIGGILLAIAVMFSWRWRTGTKAILLMPTINTIGKILLWGIIIPVAGYLLISSLGVIGGHEYGLLYNSALYFQILLLLTLIPGITFYLAKKQVIMRCRQLEIALPEQKKLSKPRIIALWSIIVILAIAALVPYTATKSGEVTLKFIFLTTIALALISIFLIVINFAAKFIIAFRQRQYAIYYGALAKTLLPLFASAVIFLTLICTPYLNWREASLIKQDKVIFGSPNSFTPAEAMAVAHLNSQLEKILNTKQK
jgi:HAAS